MLKIHQIPRYRDILDELRNDGWQCGGIRTSDQYLAGLRDNREIWCQGEWVSDVTSHPQMSRGAATLAEFLQRQHDPALQDTLTYLDDDGDRCAMAFLAPNG